MASGIWNNHLIKKGENTMKRKYIAVLVGVMVLLLASGTQIVGQAANKDKDKRKCRLRRS